MAVSYLRLCGHGVTFGIAVFALTFASEVHAQELVELRYEWHKQHARREAAEWEIDLIAPSRPAGPSLGGFLDPTSVVNELRPVLIGDYDALRSATLKLADAARARREEAHADWAEVYKQRLAFRQHVSQQQAAYSFDFDTGELNSFEITTFDILAAVWAVVVFAIAVRLGRRARRVSLRQAQRAALASALLVLVTLPSYSYGSKPSIFYASSILADATKEAKQQADAAVAEADKKWQAAVEGWVALVKVPGAASASVEAIVREGESQHRERLRAAATDARLANRLAKEAEAEKVQLASDRAKLSELTSSAKWRAIGFAFMRCAGVALLFGLAIIPYRRACRKEAAIVAADAKKCPRCFSEELIVELTAPPPDVEDEPRYRPGKRKPKPKAPEPAQSETGYIECKPCGFRFLRSYQKLRRLCFPAVGVRNSGKTHMLATGYDKVRKQKAPSAATIVPAPSLGDDRFDVYIDLIVNHKQEAGGTPHSLPDPVMIHVRDADPQGANTALVNLFDYAGEMLNQKIDADRLKKQAVKMDGFMLFLDPTQLDGQAGGVTLDRQLAALNEFMADMREARKVDIGDIIPVPVAIVIPKFDLLVTRNPIQQQAVPFIRRLQSEMTPAQPKQTTLAIVQERSELVEDMLELMFRGVDFRALIESYFGTQIMFFPVTSVSLFENELGIEDLSQRTIAPFGVAEPFLWLLHMHGYAVFSDNRRQEVET